MRDEKLVEAHALLDALYKADAITMEGVKIINQFPGVEAKPVVHATWFSYLDGDHIEPDVYFKCSKCGSMGHRLRWRYCPSCGSRMES